MQRSQKSQLSEFDYFTLNYKSLYVKHYKINGKICRSCCLVLPHWYLQPLLTVIDTIVNVSTEIISGPVIQRRLTVLSCFCSSSVCDYRVSCPKVNNIRVILKVNHSLIRAISFIRRCLCSRYYEVCTSWPCSCIVYPNSVISISIEKPISWGHLERKSPY